MGSPNPARSGGGRERSGRGGGGAADGQLTLRLGEDGDAQRPDVEEAEPDGGEAEGADEHQPPSQRRHALLLLLLPLRRHAPTPRQCSSTGEQRRAGRQGPGREEGLAK